MSSWTETVALGDAALDADGWEVERARSGDAAAFDRLFQRHFPRVFRFAHRMCGDADMADDAAQGAFVRTYRALGGLRDGQSFLKYLYRAALNLLRDASRRAMRKPEAPLERGAARIADGQSAPDRQAAQAMLDRALRDALLELPDDFRAVVVLHHFEGLDVEEVAARLGVPEGTVKSRLGRARAKLRERLRGWLEE
ncbi:MAG: sigma-70 family RNA polymerase sigma factor [Fimbriimonadales bacterium]|nr:sigma-70 family RNA polymerase sigma factor [Fimbriimonadales bacterium]